MEELLADRAAGMLIRDLAAKYAVCESTIIGRLQEARYGREAKPEQRFDFDSLRKELSIKQSAAIREMIAHARGRRDEPL